MRVPDGTDERDAFELAEALRFDEALQSQAEALADVLDGRGDVSCTSSSVRVDFHPDDVPGVVDLLNGEGR